MYLQHKLRYYCITHRNSGNSYNYLFQGSVNNCLLFSMLHTIFLFLYCKNFKSYYVTEVSHVSNNLNIHHVTYLA